MCVVNIIFSLEYNIILKSVIYVYYGNKSANQLLNHV